MIVVIVRTQKGQKMTFCCCLSLYPPTPCPSSVLALDSQTEGTLEGGWAQERFFQGHVWRDGAQVEKNCREWRELQKVLLWLKPREMREGMYLQHSRKENWKSMLTLEEPWSFGNGIWFLLSLHLTALLEPSPANWHGKPRGKGLCQPSGCRSASLEQRTGQ